MSKSGHGSVMLDLNVPRPTGFKLYTFQKNKFWNLTLCHQHTLEACGKKHKTFHWLVGKPIGKYVIGILKPVGFRDSINTRDVYLLIDI